MSGPDTSMGGGLRDFPPTPGFIKPAPGEAPASWNRGGDQLSRIYWKPVYLFLRAVAGLSNDDAKDLTQQFFLHLLESRALARYEPARAPFRVFLKSCLRNFLADDLRARGALKRGGDRSAVPLEAAGEAAAPEAEFDQGWLQALLETALEEVRADLAAQGRSAEWALFEAYDLRAPSAPAKSYAELGREHGLTEAGVRNALAYARGKLRERVVDEVRRSTADAGTLRAELGHLGFLA
jgi:RNA polymerase sigma-70 factor (ECF subfamily)